MTQTAERTADQLRIDALQGPWQVAIDCDGEYINPDDDEDMAGLFEEQEVTISVVRGSAAPVGGHMPGLPAVGDVAAVVTAYVVDPDDASQGLEARLAQARAMAAGLNAASDTLSAAPAGAQATPTPVNVTGEAVAHCPDCDIAVPIGEITDEGRHAECGAFVQPA